MQFKRKELDKYEILNEACEVCTCKPVFNCKDITLLVNACAEAARHRRDNNMPHVEKFEAMRIRLEEMSEKLDAAINDYVTQRTTKLRKKARAKN